MVECAELSAEQRAEVEVRHLVELQSLPGEPSTLRLRCTSTSVEGVWQRGEATLSSRSVSRTPSDNLVEVTHWLASMLIGVRQEQGPQESDAASPDVTSVTLQATPSPSPAGVAGEPASTIESASSGPSPSSSAGAGDAPLPAPSPRRTPRSWGLGVAASYHLLGTEIPGTLGPSVDASLGLGGRFGLHLALGYEWSQGTAASISAGEAALGVHVTTALTPWLGVLLGPSLSIVNVASSTSEAYWSTTVGAEFLLRGRLPNPGFGAFAAVGVRGLAVARDVQLGDETSLTIPTWQGVFQLGMHFAGPPKR